MKEFEKNVPNKNPKICVVSFPIISSGITPLSNMVLILRSLSKEVHLITGGAGYSFFKENSHICLYEVEHSPGKNVLGKIIKHIGLQLKYCPLIIINSRKVNCFIFFLGGQELFVPILISKILRKNVALLFEGSGVKIRKARKDTLFKPLSFLVRANCIFSNWIIVYSKRLLKEYGLEKYGGKTLIAHEHFIDSSRLKPEKRLSDRDVLVGYIGRIDAEKGVLQFARAIPIVIENDNKIRFLLVGNGDSLNLIQTFIEKQCIGNKIESSGWVPQEEVKAYLNKLQLLVLPSYTEGLPNIMLEAMACGTPVLATTVGSIPDIILDGVTGFLMNENSQECIAENIIRAINNPRLEDIAHNARTLVQKEFSYDAALKRWTQILKLELQS